jgi:ubiquinone/menaquinone biosynthesis C-methylase UbiE
MMSKDASENTDIAPVSRSKGAAREAYDSMARWYDFMAGSSEQKFVRMGLALLDAGPGESVLEIGCGTGQALCFLAQRVGADGRVYGIDISPGMLAVGRARLQKVGDLAQVRMQVGDGAQLPYATEVFSAVFLSFTLELFETAEIPIVLGECWRVLRAGGRLGVVSLFRGESPGVAVRLYEWAHARLPKYIDCRPIFAGAPMRETGYEIAKREVKTMWGLPVEIILGVKR